MQFNSWLYAIFFLIVLTLCRLLRRREQNYVLLIASYIFYGAWDWRFAGLMLISTVIDWLLALQISRSSTQSSKKSCVILSLVLNLGLLSFFKYFNFFIDSAIPFLNQVGISVPATYLNIVLPVGISFYTFQSLSYTIDVYRGDLAACRNLFDFALFVSFFPQLVAGPIERATHLLPQFYKERTISKQEFEKGCWLIFWGLYKKTVIADNIGKLVDDLFSHSNTLNFPLAYLSVVGFGLQIYCDFSAYTDIARGSAKLLGFDIMRNFNQPYFAINPSDFWKRWHISLSTWLRDYLYIPLGGNKFGQARTYRNLMITMILGGLWHGAAWNYIWWGFFHGLILIGHRIYSKNFTVKFNKFFSIVIMLQFTLFGWLLFRCNRVGFVDGHHQDQSWLQLLELLHSFEHGFSLTSDVWSALWQIVFFTLPLGTYEIVQYRSQNHYVFLTWPRTVRTLSCGLLLFLIVRYGVQNANSFIYFQF